MNKTIVTFIALFFTSALLAQDCFPAGLTIENQNQIDFFQINHPNCSVIIGDLIIDESMDNEITNLTGLSSIRKIQGSLKIFQNNLESNVLL